MYRIGNPPQRSVYEAMCAKLKSLGVPNPGVSVDAVSLRVSTRSAPDKPKNRAEVKLAVPGVVTDADLEKAAQELKPKAPAVPKVSEYKPRTPPVIPQ